MRFIFLLFIVHIWTINGYLYGNRINLNSLETVEDIDDTMDLLVKEYNEYNKHVRNMDKFVDHEYKCLDNDTKLKCFINNESFKHIDYVNHTIVNSTQLDKTEKNRFNKMVNNFKTINYLHYKNSDLLIHLDDFNDEYNIFPTELYAFGGYFRYNFDEESKIKISNYLDNTRNNLKNIVDFIKETNKTLEHYNPDIHKNYKLNYRSIKKHRNRVWWTEMFGWIF